MILCQLQTAVEYLSRYCFVVIYEDAPASVSRGRSSYSSDVKSRNESDVELSDLVTPSTGGTADPSSSSKCNYNGGTSFILQWKQVDECR